MLFLGKPIKLQNLGQEAMTQLFVSVWEKEKENPSLFLLIDIDKTTGEGGETLISFLLYADDWKLSFETDWHD